MRSFRNRLLILLIGLVVAAQGVTLFTSLARMSSAERERADAQLASGARVAQQLLGSRDRQLASAVAVLTADYGLREAIATADRQTIASALANHGRRIGADLTAAFDTDAGLLATGEGEFRASPRIARTLIEDAEDGAGNTRFVMVGDAVFQVFTAAVRAPDVVGWVVLGFRVNDELAREIERLLGVQVGFFATSAAGPAVIATSDTHLLHGDVLPAAVLADGQTGVASIAGTDYLVASQELSRADPTIHLSLQKPMSEVRAPYRRLATTLWLIAGLTLLVAIPAGILVGRSAARPIQRLVEAARLVERGDYSSAIPETGGEELVELARTFNAMQSGIASREAAMVHRARHDAATGLPNRLRAEEWLAERSAAGRSPQPLACVILAVTNLPQLSASLGFDVAEDLIRQLAALLCRRAGRDALVARTGSHHFAILADLAPGQSALHLAADIRDAASRPLLVGDIAITPAMVGGVAIGPGHGNTAATLMRCAEAALEAARQERRDVGLFEAASDELQRRHLRLGADLPEALAAGELHLLFQPKFSFPERRIASLEALARWNHPQLGAVPPGEFVAIAERTGATGELTRWVLRTALEQVARWRAQGLVVEVAVNLSAADIVDPALPGYVLTQVVTHGVPATSLVLEITESAVMTDARAAIGNMELLRVAGLRFSVDDFGTGYSSLSQLRQLPVDELKIDRSFVRDLGTDEDATAIVRSIIQLGHGMGLRIVAEGIETPGQWAQLDELGCDYGQGYLMASPASAADLEARLRDAQVPAAAPAAAQVAYPGNLERSAV